MRVSDARRGCLAAALIFVVFVAGAAPAQQQAGTAARRRQETLAPAPPAPVFDEEGRRAELAARRARVAQELGPNSVLVLFSAEPRVYTGDVNYEFRQENNLYYLTHLEQPGATLVLLPGHAHTREILFLPRRSNYSETWYGAMYTPEQARARSGVGEIWDAREFKPFADALARRQPYRPRPENVMLSERVAGDAPPASPHGFEPLFAAAARNQAQLHLLVPLGDADTEEFGDAREWRREQRFAEQWKKTAGAGFDIRSAFPVFWEMRLRKSPSEVRRIQHAVDVTAEAFARAMAAAPSAGWEYEVKAEVDYTFARRNVRRGYPFIVGGGANATTLHYEAAQARVSPGDLLLMDVGAEFDHYSADITRTFPAGGKFSPAQAEIYQIVLDAQTAALAAVRPGASLAEVNEAAVRVVKDGLLRLGLITDRNSNQYQIWYIHFTSHWLGMNVHDVGPGNARLEPGMVFTVEPGLYFRPDALDHLPKTADAQRFAAAVRPAFEKYKGIGVRIEDDVVVTPEGARNLSAAIPKTIPELESFIERASREYRSRF